MLLFQVYRLLGTPPFQGNGRVRSLVHVSATHWPTFAWHDMLRQPYHATSMDTEHLKGKGYAVYEDLKPFQVSAWLPLHDLNSLVAELHDFNVEVGHCFVFVPWQINGVDQYLTDDM